MRSVASRASIERCCAPANSRKTPPSESTASSSALTFANRASCWMIVPRMTSATPARLISRVASAMSASNATPMRVPSSPASATATSASKHVDAGHRREPRRPEANERRSRVGRHGHLRLAFVAMANGALAVVRGVDVHAEAERGGGLDGLGASAHRRAARVRARLEGGARDVGRVRRRARRDRTCENEHRRGATRRARRTRPAQRPRRRSACARDRARRDRGCAAPRARCAAARARGRAPSTHAW